MHSYHVSWKGIHLGTDLTKGNPLGVIVRFTIPLLIGNIVQQLYNMADSVIVGHFVSAGALAAVGSTGTIMFLVLGFSQGLTTGFTVLTSQRFGARDEYGTKKSVANGIVLSVLVSIVITILSVASMHGVLHLMNTPAEIYDDAYTYISIICLGTGCCVFYNLFAAFLRAVGDSRMPLFFLVFSACLNVVLDLLFIISFQMGVGGAAWATIASQGISAILCAVYIVRRVPAITPDRTMWRLDRDVTARQFAIGLPMALQFAITASGTMIMQAAVNMFGAVAIAAYTAASKLQNVLTQWFISIGEALASYCGQNYGSGDVERIRRGVHVSVMISIVYAIAAGVLAVLLLRPSLTLFFSAGTDIDAMLPYAQIYMVLCAVFYIPLAFIFIFRNSMQGCGYGIQPMMGGVVELLCRLFMAVLAMHLYSYSLAAFCDAFAWIGAGIYTAIAWHFVFKKVQRDLTPQQEENH